jgi:hypothetical protein
VNAAPAYRQDKNGKMVLPNNTGKPWFLWLETGWLLRSYRLVFGFMLLEGLQKFATTFLSCLKIGHFLHLLNSCITPSQINGYFLNCSVLLRYDVNVTAMNVLINLMLKVCQ